MINGYSILRFGNVCELDNSKGYARVELDEDGITTAFLPIAFPAALSNKYYIMPTINEQVAVLLDENAEQGVIIGALYSDKQLPEGFAAGVSGVIFADGSKVVYNEGEQKLTIETGALVEIKGEANVKIANASDSLKSVLSDLLDAILAETHGTASGPTTTPINSAQYAAIKTRINALLG